MGNLLDAIRDGSVLVGDGAWGTMLMDRGLGPGDAPESVNLNSPGLLGEIAARYLEAGADLITTNTFGASPIKLAHYGLDTRAEEINRIGVEAVRSAVGDRAYVSASVGPTGTMLRPGAGGHDEVAESFHRQTAALVDAGADAICIETMMDVVEARLAVQAARDNSATIPIMATMTFDATPRGFFTLMGNSIDVAISGLIEAGADVVGSNCGNGVEKMVEIAREVDRHTDLPIIIQSNAGLPELRDDEVVYPETPEFLTLHSRDLLGIGVSIVGGCCGTGPDHIRALREMVDASQG